MTTATLTPLQKQLLTPFHENPIPAAKNGDWEIAHGINPPGTPHSTANMRCQMFGQKKKVVSWPFETITHYLKEGGGVWMSDLPCEQAQTLECIRGMRGRVLVGGLGLGLAATLLSKRKLVTEVVVVEVQQEVMDLVACYLPDPNGKITVVHADLFDYLKALPEDAFDSAFYDIWQSDGEWTFFHTVVPLLALSEGRVKTPPECWNRDVMVGQLALSIASRLTFVQHPELKHPSQKDPWEEIDGDSDSTIFHNWACLFFKWWKDTQPGQRLLEEGIRAYVRNYGTPHWQEKWQNFTELAARTKKGKQ